MAERTWFHVQVRLVEFSPDEKCIISYSSREPSNPNEKAGLLLNVYDCATGQRLRSFEGSIVSMTGLGHQNDPGSPCIILEN
jgi:uncharacterized protein with WD repeat